MAKKNREKKAKQVGAKEKGKNEGPG